MAKQHLGTKKCRRIERLTGRKVTGAFTRGGWPHGWAEVWFEGETYSTQKWPPWVNYRTGEIHYTAPHHWAKYVITTASDGSVSSVTYREVP